jgi:hypothetical protein
MPDLRLAHPLSAPEIIETKPPFSNFNFIEKRFGPLFPLFPLFPLHRIFSQARTLDFKTLVVEKIKSVGFSEEDDIELRNAGFQVPQEPLIRLSFFTTKFRSLRHLVRQKDSSFLGYAILKKIPSGVGERWIVFESVMVSSKYPNNYIHRKKRYKVNIGGNFLNVEGVLYCQQNGLTNVCAHVALRTCLSMVTVSGDFSYKEMNRILSAAGMTHTIGTPLTEDQILVILDKLGIKYTKERYFSVANPGTVNPSISYQAYLYSSIESGYPALLGFSIPNSPSGHIIPIIGHTFNEDIWVARADTSYFRIGNIKYLQSDSWLSTYLCHDDNFGSYYCLPKQYLTDRNDIFVISFRPETSQYDALDAVAIAVDYLHTDLINTLITEAQKNDWAKRLVEAIQGVNMGWFVLRTIYISPEDYIKHLSSLRGWGNKQTIPINLLAALKNNVKSALWMVEISLPELFPANRRKLGEIVLNPEAPLTVTKDYSSFFFARILDKFIMIDYSDPAKIQLLEYDAGIDTHTSVFSWVMPKSPSSFLRKLLKRVMG